MSDEKKSGLDSTQSDNDEALESQAKEIDRLYKRVKELYEENRALKQSKSVGEPNERVLADSETVSTGGPGGRGVGSDSARPGAGVTTQPDYNTTHQISYTEAVSSAIGTLRGLVQTATLDVYQRSAAELAIERLEAARTTRPDDQFTQLLRRALFQCGNCGGICGECREAAEDALLKTDHLEVKE